MSATTTAPAPARVRAGHASHAKGDASTAEAGCDGAQTEATAGLRLDSAEAASGHGRARFEAGHTQAEAQAERRLVPADAEHGPAKTTTKARQRLVPAEAASGHGRARFEAGHTQAEAQAERRLVPTDAEHGPAKTTTKARQRLVPADAEHGPAKTTTKARQRLVPTDAEHNCVQAEDDGTQSSARHDRVHVGRGERPAAARGVRQDAGSARANRPARRSDDSLIGQLNAEWLRLCADPASDAAVARWRLVGLRSLGDLEAAVRRDADGVLMPLLRLGRRGDQLALRSVFQLMLGKAVRIAATHAGRDTRANLEQAAVTALWTVVAGYPVERRPVKVAANIAMDTLRLTVNELAHQRHETPSSPEYLHPAEGGGAASDRARAGGPADLELLDLLAWAVGNGTVSREDATLLVDIYAPAPGQAGGSAAADRHGISWAAARQRASRATRRIAEAVRADGF
ncbi:hypothetical protein [Jiangella sp. DSM 45060]|uniref:hypothetical protein n=1 Tax=Jiangella sp. DSM 45060 TaxID=1798224 RepID=UPI00087C2302|nr:hypothetical protein [Jiangella sp. DSM 45060]SDS69193.1 hypothetical protein SAMN04515669_1685 [Jiangella sp. DSM 45060]